MNEKIKQALENFKCIKEDLDYFQPKDLVCTNREEQYKSVENALNDFDRYYESQQDLIKGKDEYIAKLCNDRAELKEHEKELIAEQHRLFNLAKEQETELKNLKTENDRCSKYIENLEKRTVNDGFVIDILKEFARIISRKFEHYFQKFKQGNIDQYVINETYFVKGKDKEFDLIKKVVEKYGN